MPWVALMSRRFGSGVSTSAPPVTGEWGRGLVCLPHRLGPRFPEWARAVGRRYKGRSFGAVALEMAWVAHGRLAQLHNSRF